MSWFYRKFKKSDDDSTVTLESDYISLIGSLTQTGNVTITGNETVTGTARVTTSPLYLGSGTMAIGWGTVVAPWSTGVYISGTTNYAIGSLYINTTYGTVYIKTNHASTAWATISKS